MPLQDFRPDIRDGILGILKIPSVSQGITEQIGAVINQEFARVKLGPGTAGYVIGSHRDGSSSSPRGPADDDAVCRTTPEAALDGSTLRYVPALVARI